MAYNKVITLKGTETFDDSADVVVLGYGIAGACAALEARRDGGDVLAIERASAGGGASALSSGLFYLGGGTAVQQACGYEDSADNMYRYMIASMGSENAAMVRRYCDDNVAHFDWLEEQGVPFERSCYKGKAVFLLGTEGLLATGNEKVWPYREIAQPAPRGHQAAGEGESPGSIAMEALLGRCDREGVRASYDTQGLALLTDGDGRVRGLRVRRDGRAFNIEARKGVVIATGGHEPRHGQGTPCPERHHRTPGSRLQRRLGHRPGEGGRWRHRGHGQGDRHRLHLPARSVDQGHRGQP